MNLLYPDLVDLYPSAFYNKRKSKHDDHNSQDEDNSSNKSVYKMSK